MLKKKFEKQIRAEIHRLKIDQRGQTNIIGNILTFIESQPWIIAVIFLAFLYTTTLKINVAGFDLSLGPLLNDIMKAIFGTVGFNFDWRLFVVLCFLVAVVLFVAWQHN